MIWRLLVAALLVASPSFAASNYEAWVTANFVPAIFYYGTEASGNIVNNGTGGAGYTLAAGTAPTYAQTGVNVSRGTSLLFTAASSQFMTKAANDSGTGPGDVGNLGSLKTFECWATASTTTGVMLSTGLAESGNASDRIWQIGLSNTPAANFIIFDDTGSTNYSQVIGATTLVSGNWYLVTGTWNKATQTNTLYVNGVQDGIDTSIGGSTVANAVAFWNMGRRAGDDTSYFQGKVQDCMVRSTVADTATSILNRYNFGVTLGGAAWPFLTKAPRLPDFRNPGYMDKVIDRGYNTGLLNIKAREPQYLNVGFLPFSVLPRGDAR